MHLSLLLIISLITTGAQAQVLFAHGFENQRIEPLFPKVAGRYQLPPSPAGVQLDWFLDQLAADETSGQAIELHFDDAWFNSFTVEQTRQFIAAVRTDYPDAVVTDLITATPMSVTAVIQRPGGNGPLGFMVMGTRFADGGGITQLGVSGFGGNVQFPSDHSLDLSAAADKFETLSAEPALLVARINAEHQCETLIERRSTELRATASIFKIWVLGGVAAAIAAGDLTSDTLIPTIESERAPGGPVGPEPLGTDFTVTELGRLMMGISDNTATDLLHERVGRERIDQLIGEFGVTQPAVLTPLLGISEQFHLFFSYSLDDALSYVDGSEAFQQQFLQDSIEPMGPYASGSFNNESLFTSGSWRATAQDICRAFAHHRRWSSGSDQAVLVDQALGAGIAQPNLRNLWDRVWYKGGSLVSGVNGNLVLTHAWMLEDSGEDPFVVVALSNDPDGGIDGFEVQSITGRILELVGGMR